MLSGSCLCGEVTYSIKGVPQGPSVCHCSQCRRQSGHVWASAYVPVDDINIQGNPRWHASSETAKRGFCPTCGSFLFWKANDEDTVSLSLGSVDGASGLHLEKHIFARDKGDYYEICDGLPQEATP